MSEHLIQFYDNDKFLVEKIWSFIAPGFMKGEAAVIIATAVHRAGIEEKWYSNSASGLNVQRDQFIVLDAEATLRKIMIDDQVDPLLFRTHIADVVRRASVNWKRPVRAYGEMVALLCAAGNPQAAIVLERLWSGLIAEFPLSVLCGYPMNAFRSEDDGSAFTRICDEHTHVCPMESFSEDVSDADVHRRIALLQQQANALESEIARRKEIERRLQLRERELSEISRRKDEFLATLGHELRNPLAPMMNALELMRMYENDPPQLFRLREIISRQTRLMSRLVDDLLDVSRIMRGKIELRMESVSLDQVIERAIEIVHPLIEEKKHHLHLNLPAVPPLLWADPTRLAQALANLLHNAAKYTDVGGRIAIDICDEGNHLTLIVSDTGIGIGEELLEKIFDIFVQDADALAKSRGGLGLGLTLVRNLISLHGGSVEARSEGIGKGSQFVLTLPLHRRTPEIVEQPAPPVPPRLGMRHKILIVDDNLDAAESLAEYLKVAGHETQIAHDGHAAIRLAAIDRPDVIILDIGMPAMDGYQVARHLRKEASLTSSRIIAVTGYAQEQDRISAQEAGFDHHFAKPLDVTRLMQILDELPRHTE